MTIKPFIKSISPDDPIMKPIMDAFGFDGYGRFIAVMDFCRNFGIHTLDIDLVVKQAKSNKRGAAKLLPMFQECLTKVLVKFGESLPKVSPNFDQSLPKHEGQNPHGSPRDQEEIREEKKQIDPVSDENSKLGLEGMQYMHSLNSANHQNIGWMQGWLSFRLKELEKQRPDIPKPELMRLWRESCVAVAGTDKTRPAYQQAAFDNKVKAWQPSQSQNVVEFKKPEDLGAAAKALLEFPFIKNHMTEEVLPSGLFEWREDYAGALYKNGEAFAIGLLEGVKEGAMHG